MMSKSPLNADAAKVLWGVVAALVVWTLFLAAGAYKGPTSEPTGQPLTGAFATQANANNNEANPVRVVNPYKVWRPVIVIGSTALFLAFWGAMFWLRARSLAAEKLAAASNMSIETKTEG